MRVLFIESPPSMDWTRKSRITSGGRRHPALCVSGEITYSYLNLSAASVLRKEGLDVRYVHCQSEGIDIPELEKKMKKINPDLVVIDVHHIKAPVDFHIAKIAREINSKTVFVGAFATATSEKLFELCPELDFVALREYDHTIRDLARTIEKKGDVSKVKGIKYRKGKGAKESPSRGLIQNLDELPIPAFDLVDLKKFKETVFLRLPTATTISSRGCPFNCFFCTFPNTIYSHKFRAQSPERVIEEAKYLIDEFGIREIRYDDDTFEIDRKRVFDICNGFQREKFDLTWAPQCRPDLMSKELCDAMSKAGCVKILFGVESGNDEILKKINKGMNTQQISTGIGYAKKAGIYAHNCFMLGFPWDTMETMEETFKFACELNGEFSQFAIATPLPGTPFYDMMKTQGKLIGEDWDRDSFQGSAIKLEHLSREQVNEFARKAYVNYYLRPKYILMMGRNGLRSTDHFKQIKRIAPNFLKRKMAGWL